MQLADPRTDETVAAQSQNQSGLCRGWSRLVADYDKNTDSYQRWAAGDSIYWLLEWTVLLRTIGPVEGLDVLDVACGEGRLSRALMERGARSVIGIDISRAMITRAQQQNQPNGRRTPFPGLTYRQVDARDETFTLERPVDLVTALYLFHYAHSPDELGQMCHFIARNLKTGGRFVTYTINPASRFEPQEPRMEQMFGFRYDIVDPPEYRLVIGDLVVPMWQWTKEDHEAGLRAAGLTNIQWHPLALPDEKAELTPSIQWYLDNPCCVVLSAEKPA